MSDTSAHTGLLQLAHMGGSPCVTDRSRCDTPLRRNFWVPLFSNALELRDQTSPMHSGVGRECIGEVCSRNSKTLKSSGTQKFLPMSHRHARRDRGDRQGAVAARATKTERQPPDIMAVPSSSIHSPPTLTRRPTGKAVLALEVRSRTLHAPRACRVDRGHAVGCSAAASAAYLNVISVS